jgi:protein-S-isoprenylcysteine O-methyltransferase Ste14
MYLGILLMLAGVAIWVGSLPMLVAPLGFVILTSIVFIPYEEQRLREAFGAEYEAYAKKGPKVALIDATPNMPMRLTTQASPAANRHR